MKSKGVSFSQYQNANLQALWTLKTPVCNAKHKRNEDTCQISRCFTLIHTYQDPNKKGFKRQGASLKQRRESKLKSLTCISQSKDNKSKCKQTKKIILIFRLYLSRNLVVVNSLCLHLLQMKWTVVFEGG